MKWTWAPNTFCQASIVSSMERWKKGDFGVAPEPDDTRKRSDFNNKSTDRPEFRKKQKLDNDLKIFENWVEASYHA